MHIYAPEKAVRSWNRGMVQASVGKKGNQPAKLIEDMVGVLVSPETY